MHFADVIMLGSRVAVGDANRECSTYSRVPKQLFRTAAPLTSALGQNAKTSARANPAPAHYADFATKSRHFADGPEAEVRTTVRRLLLVDFGQSATLTTKGADTFKANISEHRKDNESRDEFIGVKRKLVNEQTKGEPKRKPRVVMYHHVVFVRTP